MASKKKIEEKNIVAAGGGGCFPAGARINTPSGLRFIEDIKVGDEVYAFDLTTTEAGMPNLQPGRVFAKKVSETFVHSFGEVGYTSPLLHISYFSDTDETIHDGKLVVTGNHYILTPSRQSEGTDEGFARADELEVGDILWTQYGDQVTITAIEAGDEYDFVYNFEVEDLHTYIADGIRVHNGGGGKSSKAPVQAANTVRTKQVIRILLSPGEGELVGLKNSADIAQSVYFDGTPLRNADSSYNFENVAVEQRVGLPDQTVIPGFAAVESEQLLGLPVTTTGAVTRTLSSAAVDAVRVTIEFPQGLQSVSNSTGDASGTSVQFNIQRRIALGTWETVISPTVKEMSSGPFTAAFLIQRPALAGTWEFRVQRLTADSTLNTLINGTSVKSYTEIQNANIKYNNRALTAITVGADSTNGRIPSVALDMVGLKVKVPSNYNPVTRVYTGSWDGTFSSTLQWTDNPAWAVYDLITNTRYGLGSKIPESTIDKWSFYAASVYNDELVNDGKGTGTFEPRFTFNAQLMVQEDAWKTLNTIAATFNAKLYMHAGYLRVAQDRPATPTRIINNSNILEGLFTYSSTSASETYTQCNVTYNDPTDNFLPRTVSEVASSADRLRYGLITSSLAAYGATTEGQARRAAKWLLDTSVRQTSMVSFAVSLENAAFEPNEVFYLMDEDYSQTTQEGRFLVNSGTSVTLDKPITITSGTWTITAYSDSGSIQTRTITTGAGVKSTLTINTAFTGVNKGDAYIITGSIAPRQFRMLSMTDNGDMTYVVTAVQYDANKYARVESGIIIPDDVYWQVPQLNKVDRPTNLVVVPQTAINPDGVVYRYMNVSWTPPADGSAQKYQFQWRRNGQPLIVYELKEAFVRLQSDFSGVYEFFVNAVNSADVASPTLASTYNFDFAGGGASTLGPITALQLEGGATSFTGPMRVVWNAPVSGLVKDYKVVLSTAGGVPFKTFYTGSTGFVYSYEENVADGGPRPAIQVTVYARDTLNNLATGVASTFTSAAQPAITNLRVRTGGTSFATLDLDVIWDSVSGGGVPFQSDPNFAYFQVEVLNGATVKRTVQTQTAAFTYTFNDNVVDNGQNTPSASIIVRVTAFNKLGVSSATTSATFTPAAPPVATTLVVQGVGGTTFNQSDLSVSWVNNLVSGQAFDASNMFKKYVVEVLNGATVKRSTDVFNRTYTYAIDANTSDNAGKPIRTPTIRVTVVSVYNVSSAPLSVTFTNPAPAIPTNISVASGIGNYKVSFDQPAEADYLGTYIWASTTSGFTPSAANLVADIAGAYASINSSVGVTYYTRLASYDIFGKGETAGSNLNVSSQSTVSAQAAGISKFPTAPTSPAPVAGDVYMNTTDGKIYRYFAGAWTAAVPTVDLTGTVTNTQIADVAAAKITGQVTDAQVAALSTTKLTGTVQDAQIAGMSATKLAGQVQNAQIASLDTTKLAGQVTSAQIAALDAAKLSGQIAGTQIQDGAIFTPKLAAGAVTSTTIAANTILTGNIAAGAIQAGNIAAGAVTAKSLAVGDFENLVNCGVGLEVSGFSADMVPQSNFAAFDAAWWKTIGEGSPYTLSWAGRNNNYGPRFAVKPGDEFFCSMLTVSQGGGTNEYPLSLGFVVYDATGAAMAFPIGARRAPSSGTGAVKSEGVVTVPANASSASVFFLIETFDNPVWTNPGKGAFIGGIQVRRRNTGNLIVDGTITATNIAANAITTAKIAAGAVLADNIAAGAITTGKLLVTGQGKAINADPGFIDSSAWAKTGGAGTFSLVTDSTSPFGSKVARCSADVQFSSTGTFPIEAGKQYKVTTWARRTSGASIMYLRMYCYTASGALQNYTLTPSAEGVNPPTGWTRFTGYIVPNAGSVNGQIVIHANWVGAGITDFADCRVEEYIGADLIVDGAITATKIAATSIDASKIVAATITSAQIAADTITAGNIAANAITASEIATDAVTAGKILAGAISTDKLAANAVTADKIVANAVTSDKINAGAITADKIGASQVTAVKLSANSVDASKIVAGSITATELAAGAVTAGKILAGSITATELASNSVTAAKIAAGNVTADKIDSRNLDIKDASGNVIFSAGVNLASARVVPASNWLNNNVSMSANGVLNGAGGGQVTVAGLDSSIIRAANPITAGNIGTYIAGAAIGTAYIANAAILNAQIGDGQITAAKIGDAQITNAKIGDGQITAAKIGDAQITTAKIGVAQIDNLRLAKGNITDIRMISWQSQGPNMQSVPANGTPQPAYDWTVISPEWSAPYIGSNAFQTVVIVSFEEPSLAFANHPSYLRSRPRLQYNDGGGWADHPGGDSDSAKNFAPEYSSGFKNTNTYHYQLTAYAGRRYRMVNYYQGIIARVANGTYQSPIYTQPVCTHRLTCIFNLS